MAVALNFLCIIDYSSCYCCHCWGGSGSTSYSRIPTVNWRRPDEREVIELGLLMVLF